MRAFLIAAALGLGGLGLLAPATAEAGNPRHGYRGGVHSGYGYRPYGGNNWQRGYSNWGNPGWNNGARFYQPNYGSFYRPYNNGLFLNVGPLQFGYSQGFSRPGYYPYWR